MNRNLWPIFGRTWSSHREGTLTWQVLSLVTIVGPYASNRSDTFLDPRKRSSIRGRKHGRLAWSRTLPLTVPVITMARETSTSDWMTLSHSIPLHHSLFPSSVYVMNRKLCDLRPPCIEQESLAQPVARGRRDGGTTRNLDAKGIVTWSVLALIAAIGSSHLQQRVPNPNHFHCNDDGSFIFPG